LSFRWISSKIGPALQVLAQAVGKFRIMMKSWSRSSPVREKVIEIAAGHGAGNLEVFGPAARRTVGQACATGDPVIARPAHPRIGAA
jgi:hypothetical protein